jgi:molecular chaperone GrpE
VTGEQHDPEGVVETPVVRDRRRIDPETGHVREDQNMALNVEADELIPDDSSTAETGLAGAVGAELEKAQAEVAERLDDLKRLQAEYTNYRRRVERDRQAVRESAKVEVLSDLIGVLDDIGRARDHGDLTGAFRAVGEALEAVVAKAGLEQFGEVGDEFDPTIHEAFMHSYSDEVDVTTCTQILQPGYRIGERVVRPARVAVAHPTEALQDAEDGADDRSDDTRGDESEFVDDNGAEKVEEEADKAGEEN